jgi:hypothetical protein
MGKDIDFDAIRREFPEVDLSKGPSDDQLRRLLSYDPKTGRHRDSGSRAKP